MKEKFFVNDDICICKVDIDRPIPCYIHVIKKISFLGSRLIFNVLKKNINFDDQK